MSKKLLGKIKLCEDLTDIGYRLFHSLRHSLKADCFLRLSGVMNLLSGMEVLYSPSFSGVNDAI